VRFISRPRGLPPARRFHSSRVPKLRLTENRAVLLRPTKSLVVRARTVARGCSPESNLQENCATRKRTDCAAQILSQARPVSAHLASRSAEKSTIFQRDTHGMSLAKRSAGWRPVRGAWPRPERILPMTTTNSTWIADWNPEDEKFWNATGK